MKHAETAVTKNALYCSLENKLVTQISPDVNNP